MRQPSKKYLHGRRSTFGVPLNAASERARSAASQLGLAPESWPYASVTIVREDGTETVHVPKPALVCAWCGVTMRAGAEPVSHGICPICAVKFEQGDIA